jgi:signal transduction histidine kinase
MPEANRGRVRTDQSLRAERGKTDAELDKRRDAADRTADAVVSRARHAADGVLQAARDTADDEQGDEPHGPGVLQKRTQADAAVESARTGADEMVRREREERRRALDSLLLLEREETDQHLLTERGFSDQAVNTRDIFLAMVSHDLRTMLGGIALTAQLLARESAVASDAKAVVLRAESIQRLTARMNRLIGDLVDVASIEAGKLLVAPTEGDLREVIREAVQMFEGSAEKHQIRLAPQLDGPPLRARFDHERLLQVLGNLLGNAIKFSPPGARIDIRVERAGAEMRVAVADQGPGIHPADLEAIFGRFWQVERRARTGLGLGLYISRCILQAHGGRIWAESAPGRGSTLFFALPAA